MARILDAVAEAIVPPNPPAKKPTPTASVSTKGFLKPRASIAIKRTLMALATPAARKARDGRYNAENDLRQNSSSVAPTAA